MLLSTKGYTDKNVDILQADEDSITVSIDDIQLKNYKYDNSKLSWSNSDGNKSNGQLTFQMSRNPDAQETQEATFFGYYWPEKTTKPSKPNFTGKVDIKYLTAWNGSFQTLKKDADEKWSYDVEVLVKGGANLETSHVYFGGKEGTIDSYINPTLKGTSSDGQKFQLIFYYSTSDHLNHFSSLLWNPDEEQPDKPNYIGTEDTTGLQPWSAYYKTDVDLDGKAQWKPGPEVIIEGSKPEDQIQNKVTINNKKMSGLEFNNPVLSWNDPGNEYSATVRFYMKPGSRTRRFTGKMWKPSQPYRQKIISLE